MMSRPRRHASLFGGSVVALAAGAWLAPYVTVWERLSVVSAWTFMALLAAALLIGPLRSLGGVAPTLNIYIRRDLGIWAALHGLLHFVAGNVVGMNASYVAAFVRTPTPELGVGVRDQLFSTGAIAGTLIVLVLLLLLAISSDRALRWLGPKKWKWLQRSAHVVLWLSVIHGIEFQLLEDRLLPLVVLVIVAILIAAVQLRSRSRRPSAGA
jgi:DMSO/TMAO reductase YedYZ heme-binding membrane subunit